MKLPRAPATILVLAACLAAALSLPWPPRPALLLGALALTALATLCGVRVAGAVGLGAPLLEAAASPRRLRPRDFAPLGLGVATGIPLGVLLLFVIAPGVSRVPEIARRFAAEAALSPVQRLALSLTSAILEELFFRLLLVSFLIWLFARLFQSPVGASAPDWAGWLSVTLVALAFGAAHLPRWTGRPGIGPSTLALVVLLNAVGGVLFGYLFWRRGLEAAIAAHAAANVVLHGLGPALLA
jgi:membrane protease YdiL (CAAX protease family)